LAVGAFGRIKNNTKQLTRDRKTRLHLVPWFAKYTAVGLRAYVLPDPPNSKLGRGVKRKTVCCTCEHFVRSRAPPQPPTTLILGVRGVGEGGFVKLPDLLERLRYLQTFVLQQSCCQGRRCSLSVLLCSWGPRWPPPKAGVSRSMLLRGFGPGPLRAPPQGLSHTGGHLGASEAFGAPRSTHPTRSDNEGPSGLPGYNRQI